MLNNLPALLAQSVFIPALAFSGLVAAGFHNGCSNSAQLDSPGSCRSADPIPVVTDCPTCAFVEEGFCVGENEQPVPFKAVRSHGVVVIPQFQPGRQSSLAIGGYKPRITVKKFRTVDGALQADKSFAADGVDERTIPLPKLERLTEFTLANDKLIALSRSLEVAGLSRLSIMDLNNADSTGDADGDATPSLWVSGELFRYHDDRLYTFCGYKNRVLVYPPLDECSIESAPPIRVVGLDSVLLPGDSLLSVLADGDRAYVAVGKRATDSDTAAVYVYHLSHSGTVIEEKTKIEGAQADQQYQLDWQEGHPVLVHVPSNDPELQKLACANL